MVQLYCFNGIIGFSHITLGGDYTSFAMAILSGNHIEIDITESILVSIKVKITCTKGDFLILMSWQFGHQLQFDSGGIENYHFLDQGSWFPSKFDMVIIMTSLYEGMVVWYRHRYLFFSFSKLLSPITRGFHMIPYGHSPDIYNMATRVEITLMAGGVENCQFLALEVWFSSKYDIVIPKTLPY